MEMLLDERATDDLPASLQTLTGKEVRRSLSGQEGP